MPRSLRRALTRLHLLPGVDLHLDPPGPALGRTPLLLGEHDAARRLIRDLGTCDWCMQVGHMNVLGVTADFSYAGVGNGPQKFDGPLMLIEECNKGHRKRILMDKIDPRQFGAP